jgi:hypothetical protein
VANHTRRTQRRTAKRHRVDKPRAGLPDPASVLCEKTFMSPAGRAYRILRTTEVDPYDPPPKGEPKRR